MPAKLQKAFPAMAKANAVLLHNAIENVVRNAIKFTKRDTAVEISMLEDAGDPDRITVQARSRPRGA